MPHADHDHDIHDESEFRLEDLLRYALAIGAVLVLLQPAARGFSETLGWLPLWLLAMPAVAWWALRGFPLLRGNADEAAAAPARRRRVRPQARRRARTALRNGLPRAA